MGMFYFFLDFRGWEAEKQRSREVGKIEKQRSREAEEVDLAHGPRAISYIRASCMGNHHLQSTEDSPPSALEIHLRIHAMRAYHTVRTIGLIIETCSFSRKRRERKNCSLAQWFSQFINVRWISRTGVCCVECYRKRERERMIARSSVVRWAAFAVPVVLYRYCTGTVPVLYRYYRSRSSKPKSQVIRWHGVTKDHTVWRSM